MPFSASALASWQIRNIVHSRSSGFLASSLKASSQSLFSTSASSSAEESKESAEKNSSTSTTSTSPKKKEEDPKEKKTKQQKPESKDEIGGPKGPEPTRYNDWEKNGRVSDF